MRLCKAMAATAGRMSSTGTVWGIGAGKPHHDRRIGIVSLSGKGKRPVEINCDALGAIEHAFFPQRLHKPQRSPPRSQGMRAGRPYAYLENIEYADLFHRSSLFFRDTCRCLFSRIAVSQRPECFP